MFLLAFHKGGHEPIIKGVLKHVNSHINEKVGEITYCTPVHHDPALERERTLMGCTGPSVTDPPEKDGAHPICVLSMF